MTARRQRFAKISGIVLLLAGIACFGIYATENWTPPGKPRVLKNLSASHYEAVLFNAGMVCTIAGAVVLGFGFRKLRFPPHRVTTTRTCTDDITRLAKLRADGYITGEDYEVAKRRLLNDL